MEHQLLQLDFCKLHQPIDFVLGAVVVLYTEGVHRHNFDAALVTYLENLGMEHIRQRYALPMPGIQGILDWTDPCECLKTKIMSFNGLDFVTPGVSPVTVHLESNVLWNRPLA